ncbi:Uncharacterised protein [Escherichia coli]|nr:Uncharacterised protein [Escherichia coli]
MSIMSLKTLELVWVKAKLNLKSEASINYLSYAWWIIEPVLKWQFTIWFLHIFLSKVVMITSHSC